MVIRPENPKELIEILKLKPLVLYGMGGTGLDIAEWCDEQGIDYTFVDKNALELQKTSIKCVITPECLKNELPNATIIISSIVYYNEILENLCKLGFNDILSYSIFMPKEIKWLDLEENGFGDWQLMRYRAKMVSDWISENVKSIADYGAGKLSLKEFIPMEAKYYAIDYISRSDDTIICDFNKNEFPQIKTELSACLGVLMYIESAKDLVSHLCMNTKNTIILSYVTYEALPNIEARRYSSFVNDFTEQQIMDFFTTGGFDYKDKKIDLSNNVAITMFLFKKRGLK